MQRNDGNAAKVINENITAALSRLEKYYASLAMRSDDAGKNKRKILENLLMQLKNPNSGSHYLNLLKMVQQNAGEIDQHKTRSDSRDTRLRAILNQLLTAYYSEHLELFNTINTGQETTITPCENFIIKDPNNVQNSIDEILNIITVIKTRQNERGIDNKTIAILHNELDKYERLKSILISYTTNEIKLEEIKNIQAYLALVAPYYKDQGEYKQEINYTTNKAHFHREANQIVTSQTRDDNNLVAAASDTATTVTSATNATTIAAQPAAATSTAAPKSPEKKYGIREQNIAAASLLSQAIAVLGNGIDINSIDDFGVLKINNDGNISVTLDNEELFRIKGKTIDNIDIINFYLDPLIKLLKSNQSQIPPDSPLLKNELVKKIISLVNEGKNIESCFDIPAPPTLTDYLRKEYENILNHERSLLKAKIDNFEIENRINGKTVSDLLGDGESKLNEGCTDSKTARQAFIDELVKVLHDGSTDFKGPITNPNDDAVNMVDLFGGGENGKRLLQLYREAIEEESKSKAFRDAVFLRATEYRAGETWATRLILWVAGPSACGKSVTKNKILDMCSGKMTGNGKKDGNYITSIDGAIERETSQIRQLVLQAALQKGYPGVRNLDKHTKHGIKKRIQKAALASPALHLLIPNTFSNPFTIKKIKKYSELKGVSHFFSEIVGSNEETFRQTVERNGDRRAWAHKYGTPAQPGIRQLQMNNVNIGCESKKYHSEHFVAGKAGSETAAREFHSLSRDNYIKVTSDWIYVINKKLNNYDDWQICTDKDTSGEIIGLTERQFRAWQKLETEYGEEHPALTDWLKTDAAKDERLTGTIANFSSPKQSGEVTISTLAASALSRNLTRTATSTMQLFEKSLSNSNKGKKSARTKLNKLAEKYDHKFKNDMRFLNDFTQGEKYHELINKINKIIEKIDNLEAPYNQNLSNKDIDEETKSRLSQLEALKTQLSEIKKSKEYKEINDHLENINKHIYNMNYNIDEINKKHSTKLDYNDLQKNHFHHIGMAIALNTSNPSQYRDKFSDKEQFKAYLDHLSHFKRLDEIDFNNIKNIISTREAESKLALQESIVKKESMKLFGDENFLNKLTNQLIFLRDTSNSNEVFNIIIPFSKGSNVTLNRDFAAMCHSIKSILDNTDIDNDQKITNLKGLLPEIQKLVQNPGQSLQPPPHYTITDTNLKNFIDAIINWNSTNQAHGINIHHVNTAFNKLFAVDNSLSSLQKQELSAAINKDENLKIMLNSFIKASEKNTRATPDAKRKIQTFKEIFNAALQTQSTTLKAGSFLDEVESTSDTDLKFNLFIQAVNAISNPEAISIESDIKNAIDSAIKSLPENHHLQITNYYKSLSSDTAKINFAGKLALALAEFDEDDQALESKKNDLIRNLNGIFTDSEKIKKKQETPANLSQPAAKSAPLLTGSMPVTSPLSPPVNINSNSETTNQLTNNAEKSSTATNIKANSSTNASDQTSKDWEKYLKLCYELYELHLDTTLLTKIDKNVAAEYLTLAFNIPNPNTMNDFDLNTREAQFRQFTDTGRKQEISNLINLSENKKKFIALSNSVNQLGNTDLIIQYNSLFTEETKRIKRESDYKHCQSLTKKDNSKSQFNLDEYLVKDKSIINAAISYTMIYVIEDSTSRLNDLSLQDGVPFEEVREMDRILRQLSSLYLDITRHQSMMLGIFATLGHHDIDLTNIDDLRNKLLASQNSHNIDSESITKFLAYIEKLNNFQKSIDDLNQYLITKIDLSNNPVIKQQFKPIINRIPQPTTQELITLRFIDTDNPIQAIERERTLNYPAMINTINYLTAQRKLNNEYKNFTKENSNQAINFKKNLVALERSVDKAVKAKQAKITNSAKAVASAASGRTTTTPQPIAPPQTSTPPSDTMGTGAQTKATSKNSAQMNQKNQELINHIRSNLPRYLALSNHYAVAADRAAHSVEGKAELDRIKETCETMSNQIAIYHDYLTTQAPVDKNHLELIKEIQINLAEAFEQKHTNKKLAYFSDKSTIITATPTVSLDQAITAHLEKAKIPTPSPCSLTAQPTIKTDDSFNKEAQILETHIQTKRFLRTDQVANVTSVHRMRDETFVSEFHFDPAKIKNFRADDYLKWAVIEVENFRVKKMLTDPHSRKPVIIKGDMPPELVKHIATYCASKGYHYENRVNKFTPSKSDIASLEKRLEKNKEIIFGKAAAPLAMPREQIKREEEHLLKGPPFKN